MRRSLCPSVLLRKRPLDLDSIDFSGKRKTSIQARHALRQLTVNVEQQDEEDEKENGKDESNEYAGLSHEEKIQAILKKPFACPVIGYERVGRARSLGARLAARTALHDPDEESALVLYSPPELTETEKLHLNKATQQVHVVVDPILSKILRPHQREGVKFMYDCVTGVQIEDSYGCIMADEMGLGKTLQCITLLWTLLMQGPNVTPIIEKAIIVAPSSLVKNWGNEILKWLKNAYPRPPNALVCEGGKEVVKDLRNFMTAQGRKIVNPVLIISYDSLRLHKNILQSSEIGLVICDEGHKLKNKDNLIYAALNDLNCKRRVLLSGTPIQNDLLEYFSLVHFVNQGILGSVSEFKKRFENPILRGRDGACTDKEMELGRERQEELISIVKRCMIRRTSDLLSKYLPTKYDFVICVNFTPMQKDLYKKFISSKLIKAVAEGESVQVKKGENESLKAIMFLKKLCNHPQLIQEVLQDYSAVPTPPELQSRPRHIVPEWSGKMMFLDTLLAHIKSTTNDRVVLISNYTQTLDLFQELCRLRNYNFVRLDGSMTVKKRSKIVDQFNDPASNDFIFMLSSKAGGCGLNLIGANRLVMFDPDWNPANDSQAMARCWRDGQKKECYTYRLLATGSIEEKIFQRQTHKKALSSTLVDEADVDRHFTLSELKDLFKLEEGITDSHTHKQLKCKRCFAQTQAVTPPENADCNSDLKDWHHCYEKRTLPDVQLKYAWETGVSFAFYQKSHIQRKTV